MFSRLEHLSSSAEVRRKLQDRDDFAQGRDKNNAVIGSDDVLYSSGDPDL